MGLAEEIARVRSRARGAEINARHRRAREKARQVTAAMKETTPIDGVNRQFASALDAAREKARAATAAREEQPRDPGERIEQLVREGKLPARAGGLGVGYEPTPEEILGELSEAAAPDGTEELPDADAVLAGDAPYPPEQAGNWGAPPAAAAPPAASGAPALARSVPGVQSKRKRGK